MQMPIWNTPQAIAEDAALLAYMSDPYLMPPQGTPYTPYGVQQPMYYGSPAMSPTGQMINPMTGQPYPVGTQINPATGQPMVAPTAPVIRPATSLRLPTNLQNWILPLGLVGIGGAVLYMAMKK